MLPKATSSLSVCIDFISSGRLYQLFKRFAEVKAPRYTLAFCDSNQPMIRYLSKVFQIAWVQSQFSYDAICRCLSLYC